MIQGQYSNVYHKQSVQNKVNKAASLINDFNTILKDLYEMADEKIDEITNALMELSIGIDVREENKEWMKHIQKLVKELEEK